MNVSFRQPLEDGRPEHPQFFEPLIGAQLVPEVEGDPGAGTTRRLGDALHETQQRPAEVSREPGSRLGEVRAHTSSGNITLLLPRDASFDAAADQSSGDTEVRFSGGTATRRHDKLVAYRRGTDGTRIRLETSSGDVEISPR